MASQGHCCDGTPTFSPAGHLCRGHVPVVLQLFFLTLSAVLLLAVLIKGQAGMADGEVG